MPAGCGVKKRQRRGLIRRWVALVITCNILNLHKKIKSSQRRQAAPWGSPGGDLACVFFAQHSAEKRPKSLWEDRFFVARGVPSVNVLTATEGGIPVSRCPGRRIAPSGKSRFAVKD